MKLFIGWSLTRIHNYIIFLERGTDFEFVDLSLYVLCFKQICAQHRFEIPYIDCSLCPCKENSAAGRQLTRPHTISNLVIYKQNVRMTWLLDRIHKDKRKTLPSNNSILLYPLKLITCHVPCIPQAHCSNTNSPALIRQIPIATTRFYKLP